MYIGIRHVHYVYVRETLPLYFKLKYLKCEIYVKSFLYFYHFLWKVPAGE
jgi:hypothetical protein